MSDPSKTRPERWREFYNDALRESGEGDNAARLSKVDLAISICHWRLIELAPDPSSEREEISIALDDLNILKGLCRKTNKSA
jgi:hypothetical protein